MRVYKMYSEIHKAGTKHVLIALAAGIAMSLLSGVVKFFLRNIPLAEQIVTISFFAVLVYFVYIHYASQFEYKISGYKLIITRKTGRRIKVIEIKSAQIDNISSKKPKNIKTDKMTVAVFFAKNPIYITYGDKAVLIDGSDELCEHINLLKCSSANSE